MNPRDRISVFRVFDASIHHARAEKTRNRQAVRRRFGIRVGNQTREITLVIVAIGALRQIPAEQIDAAPTPSRTRHAADFEAAVFGVEVEDSDAVTDCRQCDWADGENDLGGFCVVGQTRIDPPFGIGQLGFAHPAVVVGANVMNALHRPPVRRDHRPLKRRRIKYGPRGEAKRRRCGIRIGNQKVKITFAITPANPR